MKFLPFKRLLDNMKKILATLIIICCSASVFSQTQFVFKGKISGASDLHCIFMYQDENGENKMDSSVLKDGEFSFKGNINSPIMGYFTVNPGSFKIKDDSDPNTKGVFLAPGVITATGKYDSLKEMTITGSKSQSEFEELQNQYGGLNAEYNRLAHDFDIALADFETAQKNNKDKKLIDSLHAKMENIRDQYQNFQPRYLAVDRLFILSHPNSSASSFELEVDFNQLPYDTVKSLFNELKPIVREGYYGKAILEQLTAIENNSVGKIASNFTATDLDGKPLTFSSLRGKVILLDFWASWCKPCRESTPHLIELYRKYHGLGFDIIAIGDDDQTKGAWIKAIAQDSSSLWHNVLRGHYSQNKNDDIANKFAVSFLPTRILIDENGFILARYGGNEDNGTLDNKLAAIFKQ